MEQTFIDYSLYKCIFRELSIFPLKTFIFYNSLLNYKQAFRSKAAGRGQQLILVSEVNETLKRIQETKNVIGTMVINHDGIPVKSSIDSSVTAQVLLRREYNPFRDDVIRNF